MTNNKLEEVHYYQSIRKRQLSTDTMFKLSLALSFNVSYTPRACSTTLGPPNHTLGHTIGSCFNSHVVELQAPKPVTSVQYLGGCRLYH